MGDENRVEAIIRTSRVSTVRGFGFLNSEKHREQPKKKKKNAIEEQQEKSKGSGLCSGDNGDHIDCSV